MLANVAHTVWEVHKVSAHHPGLYVNDTARAGATWPMTQKIYLSDELSGDQVYRVILHELSHAWLHATQVSQQESWNEEELCDMIAIYGPDIVHLATAVHKQLYPEVQLRGL